MSASITWLGHATFRLILPNERVVIIDPWLTDNPACPDALKNPDRCDFIFLTHGHGDHTGDVARLVKQFDPVVVGNFELCNVLAAQVGTGRFTGMNPGGTIDLGGMHVSLTKAFHSSSIDGPNGPIYTGMPNGLVVGVDGLATLYHAGDTDVFGDMAIIAKLLAPKVCILPIGDHFTMGAKGAALAVELLQPTTIIPCHYKTFPLLAPSADDFRDALAPEYKDRLAVAEVGQSLTWTANGAA